MVEIHLSVHQSGATLINQTMSMLTIMTFITMLLVEIFGFVEMVGFFILMMMVLTLLVKSMALQELIFGDSMPDFGMEM